MSKKQFILCQFPIFALFLDSLPMVLSFEVTVKVSNVSSFLGCAYGIANKYFSGNMLFPCLWVAVSLYKNEFHPKFHFCFLLLFLKHSCLLG